MKVFYTPASGQLVPRVIDSVVLIDGEERGAYSRETLAELAKRYPTVTVGDLDEVSRIKEEMMRSDPEPCTEEQFWEALECLPRAQTSRSSIRRKNWPFGFCLGASTTNQ
jgi:hypothetical protein